MYSLLKRGMIFLTFVALFIVGLPVASAKDTHPIKLIVDGREVTTDVAPQLIEGRTMVPVRFVSEALGASVSWDQSMQAVLINSNASQAQARGEHIQLIVNGVRSCGEYQ